MAQYVFSATGLKPSAAAVKEIGVLGETIADGDFVYKKATDGKWYLADANSGTAEVRRASGWVMAGGVAGQTAVVIKEDPLMETGATTTQEMKAGDVLVLSTTPGKAQPAPADDLSYALVLGVALSATTVNFKIVAGGQVPAA